MSLLGEFTYEKQISFPTSFTEEIFSNLNERVREEKDWTKEEKRKYLIISREEYRDFRPEDVTWYGDSPAEEKPLIPVRTIINAFKNPSLGDETLWAYTDEFFMEFNYPYCKRGRVCGDFYNEKATKHFSNIFKLNQSQLTSGSTKTDDIGNVHTNVIDFNREGDIDEKERTKMVSSMFDYLHTK